MPKSLDVCNKYISFIEDKNNKKINNTPDSVYKFVTFNAIDSSHFDIVNIPICLQEGKSLLKNYDFSMNKIASNISADECITMNGILQAKSKNSQGTDISNTVIGSLVSTSSDTFDCYSTNLGSNGLDVTDIPFIFPHMTKTIATIKGDSPILETIIDSNQKTSHLVLSNSVKTQYVSNSFPYIETKPTTLYFGKYNIHSKYECSIYYLDNSHNVHVIMACIEKLPTDILVGGFHSMGWGNNITLLDELTINDTLLDSGNINDTTFFRDPEKYCRISPDGNFMLLLTNGNLNVVYLTKCNVKGNVAVNGLKIGYTNHAKQGNQNYHLFHSKPILQDSNVNDTYFVNDSEKIISKVPSSIIEQNRANISNFSHEFKHFIPDPKNQTNYIIGNKTNCNDLCKNEPNCNHYYNYRKSNGKNCMYDTKNKSPNYVPIGTNSSYINSSLYIKNNQMSFVDSSYHAFNNIPQFSSVDNVDLTSNHFTGYQNISNPYLQDHSDIRDVGDLLPLYKTAIEMVEYMVYGNDEKNIDEHNKQLTKLLSDIKEKEYFTSMKEGYVSGTSTNVSNDGYVTGDLDSANIINSSGYLKDLVNYKLDPLIAMSHQVEADINNIDANYQSIEQEVNENVNIRNALLQKDIYDYDGKLTNFDNTSQTLDDAVVEDTSTLIYMENSIYILGSITAATLLIIAVFMMKD